MQIIRKEKQSKNPFVPIIVVSANTEVRHILTARDAGMTEFLAKPISTGLIYARICLIIERQRLFIRCNGFFGSDRRRRSLELKGQDRRDRNAEINKRKKTKGILTARTNGVPDKTHAHQILSCNVRNNFTP
jgi:two-component system chemotaxis response regulator CheY